MGNRGIELLEVGLPHPFQLRMSSELSFEKPYAVVESATLDTGERAGNDACIRFWLNHSQDGVLEYAPRIEILFGDYPHLARVGLDFLQAELAFREIKRQNHHLQGAKLLLPSFVVATDMSVQNADGLASPFDGACLLAFLCLIVGCLEIPHRGHLLDDAPLPFRTLATTHGDGLLVDAYALHEKRVYLGRGHAPPIYFRYFGRKVVHCLSVSPD